MVTFIYCLSFLLGHDVCLDTLGEFLLSRISSLAHSKYLIHMSRVNQWMACQNVHIKYQYI